MNGRMSSVLQSLAQLSVVVTIGAAVTFTAFAALPEGQPAPDFKLQAALDGKQTSFHLQQARMEGPVVIYFYPSAYTEGCNIQAHEFSVKSEKFSAAGARVLGISLDSISRLKEFSADPDYCAGKLAVASDIEGRVAKAYGLTVKDAIVGAKDSRGEVITHGFAERTTFIINADGKIAKVIEGVSPRQNVTDALSAVEALVKKD